MSIFDSVVLSCEQMALMKDIRNAYKTLHENIESSLPENSRRKSLALTKLEESAMWLNKAISHKG